MKKAARLALLAAGVSVFATALSAQSAVTKTTPPPNAVPHVPEGNLVFEAAALALIAGAGIAVWARRSKSNRA